MQVIRAAYAALCRFGGLSKLGATPGGGDAGWTLQEFLAPFWKIKAYSSHAGKGFGVAQIRLSTESLFLDKGLWYIAEQPNNFSDPEKLKGLENYNWIWRMNNGKGWLFARGDKYASRGMASV